MEIEEVSKIMEDNEVDSYIEHDLDVIQFSKKQVMRNLLKDWIWNCRNVLKRFARIKGVVHMMKLKPGAEPVSCAARRCSPKEQELERTSMSRFVDLKFSNNLFLLG